MAARRFTAKSFLMRWLAAMALVLVTFNPTGYSYLHWLDGPTEEALPFKVIIGLFLAILYVIFLRATWRSIGPIGVGMAAAFFGAIIWAMFYYKLIEVGQTSVLIYIGLLLLATIMALGLSWSHIRRRISGQMDVDDVDE